MRTSPASLRTRSSLILQALASQLVARVGALPHATYAEPFVGMGGVFLRRPTPAPVEVINDLNRDIYVLFRVLQDHYGYLIDCLRFRLSSRSPGAIQPMWPATGRRRS